MSPEGILEIVMGATVTTRKKVFAKEVGGQVFYWLVEWTYEKNCYPHVAHESCVAFGRAEKVFPRMFGHRECTVEKTSNRFVVGATILLKHQAK